MSMIGWFMRITLFAGLLLTLSSGPGWAATVAERTSDTLPRVLVLGDSLTAGHGLLENESFPDQLEQALVETGCPAEVINAGVSGDTTAGGLARLDWALGDHPDAVIVELGGNDALRGLPPEQSYANLEEILSRLKSAGVTILLTGMRAPRNLGEDYYNSFDQIYPDLAAQHDVAFYPFFLDGVATDPELNQSDGIHPNAHGVAVIVKMILPSVLDLLSSVPGTSSCSHH